MTKELVLGERYTDRYSETSGVALEINAFINGCFLVGLQPKPDENGKRSKLDHTFDTYLDDDAGNPVTAPQAFVDRSKEILGKKYRDSISGLEGTATSVRFVLNGTEQIGIQPRGDGKEHPNCWSMDSAGLEEVASTPVPAAPRIGGPSAPAVSM
jgi:hypothetical protein